MGGFDGSHEEKKSSISTTVDLGPIEKQITLMATKINLTLSEFKALPFDATGIEKKILILTIKRYSI